MGARDNSDQLTQEPVFLVGSERSGTTMLRLMLDHNPEVAFNQESEFFVTCVSDSGEFPKLDAYRKFLLEDRVFRHTGFTIDENLGFRALLNDFLRQKRDRDNKRIVGATVHYQFRKLGYVWPRARYIYLFRDGRDVASSVVQMGWAGNEYVAADTWLSAEAEWSGLRHTLKPADWIEVRYEELTADPRAELRRICDFMGVAYSERMFDYVNTSTYSWPDPGNNYKWRRTTSRKKLQLLEARIGSRLRERGYELSSEEIVLPSRARDAWLKLHSRLCTLRFRIANFGLGLVLVETLSRRLGWAGMHRAAQRAIDRIVDQNLK